MKEISLTDLFRDFHLEDKAQVLGTIRAAISTQMAQGGQSGSVSGEIWLLLNEILEEDNG